MQAGGDWPPHILFPQERTKSKNLSKFKKVLVEAKLAPADTVKIDHKRGIVFVGRIRVAEWKADGPDNKLIASPEKLKQAHIDVNPTKLYDALEELMNE